jgi:hypothetical protein
VGFEGVVDTSRGHISPDLINQALRRYRVPDMDRKDGEDGALEPPPYSDQSSRTHDLERAKDSVFHRNSPPTPAMSA